MPRKKLSVVKFRRYPYTIKFNIMEVVTLKKLMVNGNHTTLQQYIRAAINRDIENNNKINYSTQKPIIKDKDLLF